jgi:hypothetical protein
MYIDYLTNEISESTSDLTSAQVKKWNAFKNNLFEGISFYEDLFNKTSFFQVSKTEILKQFQFYKAELGKLKIPELVTV